MWNKNRVNNDNAQYGTKGGNNTKDNLFLLSIDEVNKYFITDSQRTAVYATCVNVYVNWWLRSSGRFQSFASYVNKSGDIIGNEDGGIHNNYGVRPALWVKYQIKCLAIRLQHQNKCYLKRVTSYIYCQKDIIKSDYKIHLL